MKTIHKITALLFVGIGLTLSFSAGAQDFKTTESIKTQLLQGTTPGLQTAPATQKKQSEDNTREMQYTKGNFKAFLEKTSRGSGSGNAGIQAKSAQPVNARAKTGGAQIPSDVKAQEPEQKKTEGPKLPPMQKAE